MAGKFCCTLDESSCDITSLSCRAASLSGSEHFICQTAVREGFWGFKVRQNKKRSPASFSPRCVRVNVQICWLVFKGHVYSGLRHNKLLDACCVASRHLCLGQKAAHDESTKTSACSPAARRSALLLALTLLLPIWPLLTRTRLINSCKQH